MTNKKASSPSGMSGNITMAPEERFMATIAFQYVVPASGILLGVLCVTCNALVWAFFRTRTQQIMQVRLLRKVIMLMNIWSRTVNYFIALVWRNL